MDEALNWRTKAFLVVGIPCLLLALSADSLAAVLNEAKTDPDGLTIGSWLFLGLQSFLLARMLFGPAQILKMRERVIERKGSASLEEMGKALSFLATSLISTPIAMGMVLLAISGDAWRMYVFIPRGT